MDKNHWARLERLTQTCGPERLGFLFQVVSNFEDEDFDALRFLTTSLPLENLLRVVQPVSCTPVEKRQLLQRVCTRIPDSKRDSFASFQSVQSQDSGYSSTGPLVEIPGSKLRNIRVGQNLQPVSHQDYTDSAARKARLIHAHQKETFVPTLDVVKNTNYVTSPHNENSPASTTYGKDKKFPCPICRAQGVDAGASRADDLKTHVKRFHCSNTVWQCPSSGCGLLFEFREAYKKHARAHRGGRHVSNKFLDATMIELIPQVVFACGFAECHLKSPVFEATDERNINKAASEFCTHLAEHYHKAKSTGVGEWDFRVEIHNLLHQHACHQLWSEKAAPFDRDSFRWDETSSFELKKVLERRHWEASNLPKILSIALRLGDLTLEPLIARSGSSNWRLPLPRQLTPFQSQNSCVDTFPQEAAATGPGKFDLEDERYQVSATSQPPEKPDPPQDFVGKTKDQASAKPMYRNTPYDDALYEELEVMPSLPMDQSPSSFTLVASETSSSLSASVLGKAISPGIENSTSNHEQPFNSESQHQQLASGYPAHIQGYGRDFEPPPPQYTLPSNSNFAVMSSDHGLSTGNLGAYAPGLENTARKTLFGALPSTSQIPPNFSRPRKSYENLRHQPRPVSVTMTDDDAPPMPGHAASVGTEATFGGVYPTGTPSSYAYTGF